MLGASCFVSFELSAQSFSYSRFSPKILSVFSVNRVVGYLITALLQIVQVCQEQNFENRSIFAKDMDKKFSGTFFMAHAA